MEKLAPNVLGCGVPARGIETASILEAAGGVEHGLGLPQGGGEFGQRRRRNQRTVAQGGEFAVRQLVQHDAAADAALVAITGAGNVGYKLAITMPIVEVV